MHNQSRRIFLFLTLRQRPLILLQILLQKPFNDSFPRVDEPIIHLIHGQLRLPCHFLLLGLRGIRIMEVFQQPFLHDAGRLQWYLAIFSFFAVFLLYLLFLLKLLLGLV